MINGHSLIVAGTGSLFIISAMLLLAVTRLMGPTYHTKVNGRPWTIAFFFVCAAILFWRASTILFPGEIVDVSKISWVAPAEAAVVLGLCTFILDVILRDRAPPPLLERLLGLRRLDNEHEIITLAMNTPPALHANPAPAQYIAKISRRTRIMFLGTGLLAISALVVFLVSNAGA